MKASGRRQRNRKVHDEIADNLCFDWGWIEDNRAAVDAAFRRPACHHAGTGEQPPDPERDGAARGDRRLRPRHRRLHADTTSQNPHLIRLLMGAFVLGIPENKLRVVAPDVGGGFGSKIYHYGEEAAVPCRLQGKLNRPVKWTADRSESFLSDAHGRDHVTKIELALTEGKILAFRTETYANMGAYLSTFATATPTYLHGTLMAGPYKTPLIYVNVKAVFTNTVPVDAYRGAGRPEATFQLERWSTRRRASWGWTRSSCGGKNFIRPTSSPTDAGRAGLRHRQLPRDAGQGCWRWRTGGLRGPRGGSKAKAASCAASASRPGHRGLRHRAVEPGGRSARGRGFTKRRRCG
jgi:aerobic carbon-monoxide dehydrogenase large subunit